MLDVIKYLHSFLVCRSTQKFSIRLCGGGSRIRNQGKRNVGKISRKKPSSSITRVLFYFALLPTNLSFFHPLFTVHSKSTMLTKLFSFSFFFSCQWNWKIFNRKMDFYNLLTKFFLGQKAIFTIFQKSAGALPFNLSFTFLSHQRLSASTCHPSEIWQSWYLRNWIAIHLK